MSTADAESRRMEGLPFAELHAAVMASHYAICGGDTDGDDYTCMLVTYQYGAAKSDMLDTLADGCERRVRRYVAMPRELIAAYAALVKLARWRSAQLREGRV